MGKNEIITGIGKLLKDRVGENQMQLQELETSRNTDSKSTAGDKHETGRAMAQLEVDRAREQLSKVSDQLASFNQIDFDNSSETVRVGSYVEANNLKFLLGIGLGKVEIEESTILAISVASPVGNQLLGKKLGDQFQMGPKTLTISNIE